MELVKFSFRNISAKVMDATAEILREIRCHGPITFARFMEIALYHPEFGYYQKARSPIGPEGDYFTSPHIHPAFARCLARQIQQAWAMMGEPDVFNVVELGSGSGILASHLMRYLSEAVGKGKVSYLGVEASSARREESMAILKPWIQEGTANVVAFLPEQLTGPCFVIANEFFDALPFHRVVQRENELYEIYVSECQGRLIEVEGQPQREVLEFIDWLDRKLPDGSETEVNLAMVDWMQRLASVIQEGYVLVIDYGYTSDEVAGRSRPKGTALAYFRQTYSDDLLARPGEQDITAHVDFTALCKAAREVGFEVAGFTTQAYFLAALGVGDAIAELLEAGAPEESLRAVRLAISELVWPPGLGGFKVMALVKGAVPHNLDGFSLFNLPNPCQ